MALKFTIWFFLLIATLLYYVSSKEQPVTSSFIAQWFYFLGSWLFLCTLHIVDTIKEK